MSSAYRKGRLYFIGIENVVENVWRSSNIVGSCEKRFKEIGFWIGGNYKI